jgi:hypothetical protein
MKLLKDKADETFVQRATIFRRKPMNGIFREVKFTFPRVIVHTEDREQG